MNLEENLEKVPIDNHVINQNLVYQIIICQMLVEKSPQFRNGLFKTMYCCLDYRAFFMGLVLAFVSACTGNIGPTPIIRRSHGPVISR